jgi:peptide deformylase
MAVFPIRKFGDPILKEKCQPVDKVTAEVKKMVKNMADSMYHAPGVGLAACQIGILSRIVVLDVGEGLEVYINPEIIGQNGEKIDMDEGCLSFPDVRILVPRFAKVKIKARDGKGDEFVVEADDLRSHALQHEIDHIDGILIIDRACGAERRKAFDQLGGLIGPSAGPPDKNIL